MLNKDLVFFDYETTNCEDFLKGMGNIFCEMGYVKESYAEAVWIREQEFPTGLPTEGISIALPHTYPEHALIPSIAVVKLKEPVIFKEMGDPEKNLPIKLAFFIIGTDTKKQLNVLQDLMNLFGNKEILLAIDATKNHEELIAILEQAFQKDL